MTWLVLPNGTLVNTDHIVSIEIMGFGETETPQIVVALVKGRPIVIDCLNLEAAVERMVAFGAIVGARS